MSVESCVHVTGAELVDLKLLLGFSCTGKSKTAKFQPINKLRFIDFQRGTAVWWLELSPHSNGKGQLLLSEYTTIWENHVFLKPLIYLSPF